MLTFLKKYKWQILVPVVIVAVLAGAFLMGLSGTEGTEPSDADLSASDLPLIVDPSESSESADSSDSVETSADLSSKESSDESSASSESTVSKPESTSKPSKPETPPQKEPTPPPTPSTAKTCKLSITCKTILNNMDLCAPDRKGVVPANGIILGQTAVNFEDGESVYDVLRRVCNERGIPMESSFTPAYNSAYIEGINNIYEFDVGPLSGWMYRVNGWYPNYGCSGYRLSDGDVIEFIYTCDLGNDIGGGNAL